MVKILNGEIVQDNDPRLRKDPVVNIRPGNSNRDSSSSFHNPTPENNQQGFKMNIR
jgi:hypothetical protein